MRKSVFYIFFGLLLLSLLTPVWVFSQQLFPYITSKAFYFRICVELALPFYLYLVLIDKTLRPKIGNPLNVVVLFFLLINIVSAYFGVNVGRSLWGNFERMGGVYYLGHLTALYFYVQLIGQSSSEYLKRFLQSFLVVGVFVALIGLSAWVGGPMLVDDPSLPDRVSSTFGNPIFFASFLIIPLFLSAYFAFQEEKRSLKVIYWVTFVIQLLGIYSSGTRGALVGLVGGFFIGGLCYILLNRKSLVRKYGLFVLGFTVIFIGLIFASYNKIPQDSKLLRIFKLQDGNTQARLIQWKVALRGFKDSPLLGVGPENYYVISNKYFNPEIYKYDESWFDKPHNYLIEVLTTNGIVGLLVYLSMFGLGIFGLWKAYKASLFGLMEFCLLVSALVAYEVQNLTVFDTVSASIAFYIFLGFSAFVWVSSAEDKISEGVKKNTNILATSVFLVGLAGMLYVIYATNIIPLQISKRINFGNAYTGHDDVIASNYFNSALTLPFNFDKGETISRYSDFVSKILSDSKSKATKEFKIKELDAVSPIQRVLAERVNNNPLYWMRVAVNEMNLAVVHSTPIEASQESINRAIALSPKRVEILQLKIQYDNYKQDWPDALKVAEEIYALNPYSPKLQWQLAISYFLNNRVEDAAKMADEAIAKGYRNTQLQQFGWYIQYYSDKKDYKKVVPLLELAVELEPNDLGLYYNLAIAYAKIGDNDHAIALARQIMQTDPSQTTNMENFIKSLETK